MEKEFNFWAYYDDEDGQIIGAVHKLGTGSNAVWIAKMYRVENFMHQELHNGQFIDSDYAKRSVERYWEIESRTLLEDFVASRKNFENRAGAPENKF
jgi:hypothetical protein